MQLRYLILFLLLVIGAIAPGSALRAIALWMVSNTGGNHTDADIFAF